MDLSYDGNGMFVGYTQSDTYSDWAGAQFTNVYSREITRDGDRILSEKVTSIDGSLLTNDVKTVNYAYDEKGASGMTVNNVSYYFVRNIFGDVTAIYDESRNKKAEYSYDAWGTCYMPVNVDGIGSLNPFRYRGYYFVSQIGLYYLTTRFYDYMTGRFVNADVPSICIDNGLTIPEGCNLYSYCLNNPVMCVDPTGHMPEWLKWLIGGIVIAGLAIATIATGGAAGGVAGFILAGAFKGAAIGAVSGALVSGVIGGISSSINGDGFWSGFASGAASGFMSGAIIGGITGAISSSIQVANAAKSWDKGTYKSGFKSMKNHYQRKIVQKGLNRRYNIVKYTRDAIGFSTRHANSMSFVPSYKGLQPAWTLNTKFFGIGWNGQFTAAGKIITFGIW